MRGKSKSRWETTQTLDLREYRHFMSVEGFLRSGVGGAEGRIYAGQIFSKMPCINKGVAMKQTTNDNWLPANNGTETPFTTRTGKRLLYVWQPSTGKHAYLDCDTDLILSDEEAFKCLALF